MTFIGDVEFVDGRSPSETTTVILLKCLRRKNNTGEKDLDRFFERLSIKPGAFFNEINTDWVAKPFIGQHVFKVVQAAGYEGTEADLWIAITGTTAPYGIKRHGAQRKKSAVTKR